MSVNIIRNVMRYHMPAERKWRMQKISNSCSAVILRPITKSFVDANRKTRTKTWQYFPGPHRDFIGLQSWLRNKGLVKETVIGNCHAK
ncbi:MAG TPA: hypothetical protein VLH16_06220, partial [Bacteroidales bacterium]|nr:hypothetical protein [Bacteroidales bacterium]